MGVNSREHGLCSKALPTLCSAANIANILCEHCCMAISSLNSSRFFPQRVPAAMFSKRPLPHLEDVPAAKRLRENLADLFLSNEISGQRATSLFRDAHDAGAAHFRDLRRMGAMPGAKKNSCRDVLRVLVRRTSWPKLYMAPVRVWSSKLQQEVVVPLPFLLPHELIEVLVRRVSMESLLCQDGMCMETRQHLQSACDELRVPQLLGVGLWLDGVPCNWDRSASLEVVAMSLPGLPAGSANFRLPLTVIEKKFCYMHNTMDDILEVITWSLRCLAGGVMPSCRHDGTAWSRSDGRRGKLAAKPIGVQGVLAEVRGDWMCFKSTFRLPTSSQREARVLLEVHGDASRHQGNWNGCPLETA